MGKKEAALHDFNTAIKLNPKEDSAYYWKGLVLAKIGKNGAARDNLNKAIALNNKNDQYYYTRARIYYWDGRICTQS